MDALSHMLSMVHISLTNTGSVASSSSTRLFVPGGEGCLIIDHNRHGRAMDRFKDRYDLGVIEPRDTLDIFWWTDLSLAKCEVEVVCEHAEPLKLNCTLP